MNDEVSYVTETLESLTDDLNAKSREELQNIISKLKKDELTSEDLIKIQEDLEEFTAVFKMDSFTRTEIMNLITEIEMIYNG